MKHAFGTGYNCVLGTKLAESERRMLEYFANVVTKSEKNGAAPACDYWIDRRLAEAWPRAVDSKHWTLVWQGARHGDMRERFFLFRTQAPAMVAY